MNTDKNMPLGVMGNETLVLCLVKELLLGSLGISFSAFQADVLIKSKGDSI